MAQEAMRTPTDMNLESVEAMDEFYSRDEQLEIVNRWLEWRRQQRVYKTRQQERFKGLKALEAELKKEGKL